MGVWLRIGSDGCVVSLEGSERAIGARIANVWQHLGFIWVRLGCILAHRSHLGFILAAIGSDGLCASWRESDTAIGARM
eukprot:3618084-Karenia_brevis.AAC.1